VLFGQIDVENNNSDGGSRIVAVRFVEKRGRSLSVLDDVDFRADIRGVDRCADKKYVRRVVFYDQDVWARACLLFRPGG
jgi:hypothetical protein